MAVRVLITGDRHWECAEMAGRLVDRLVARFGAELVVVHGDARGVDAAFAAACRARGVAHEPHPARWDDVGKSAGPRRNQEMIDSGADFCIAVHRSLAWSRGTRDCAHRCLKAGIPVWLVDTDDGKPRLIREIPERRERREP